MKKILFILICLSVTGIAKAQKSDTTVRSVGFYISPALTNYNFTDGSTSYKPSFGGSLGFRITNKFKKGFFIEAGLGLGLFGGKSPVQDAYWNDYSGYYSYTRYYQQQWTEKELNWMAPFLVGYKTQKGKVRFQGSLGISFNLQIFDKETSKVISGDGPPSYYNDYNGPGFSFGTSMMAIARAGISVPVKKRLSVEILPTARYRMFYFTSNKMELSKSIHNDVCPWSLGLDVGLMIALDNKEPEQVYEPDKGRNEAFTMQYADTVSTAQPLKRKLLNDGPKNFTYLELGGNGMVYSFNYERTVYRNGIVNIQARAGFGMEALKFAIPLGANIALGTARKKFEAGLTVTMNDYNRDSYDHISRGDYGYNAFNVSIDPSLAFRLESNTHFFLRLAVMTHYFPSTGGLMPGAGVSLGCAF